MVIKQTELCNYIDKAKQAKYINKVFYCGLSIKINFLSHDTAGMSDFGTIWARLASNGTVCTFKHQFSVHFNLCTIQKTDSIKFTICLI